MLYDSVMRRDSRRRRRRRSLEITREKGHTIIMHASMRALFLPIVCMKKESNHSDR